MPITMNITVNSNESLEQKKATFKGLSVDVYDKYNMKAPYKLRSIFDVQDFQMSYSEGSGLIDLEVVKCQEAKKMKYFKFVLNDWSKESFCHTFFSSDLEKLLNLPQDIPASGNNPAIDGFITAVAKLANSPDEPPEVRKEKYEAFKSAYAETLTHVSIQYRHVVGYKFYDTKEIEYVPEEDEYEFDDL
jgi:hypothetical protein